MKRAKNRRPRQRAPRAAADPSPASVPLPPRPEFIHMDDRHLIWRATLRPAPGLPLRPITWDLQFRENEVAVCADLDREGEMRDVDFREVRRRLDGILLSEHLAQFLAASHPKRLRRSLYWQRTPDDDCCHLSPAQFDEEDGFFSFGVSIPRTPCDWKLPLDGFADRSVVRPASNQMLLERREERQWAAYARQRLEWARKLSLDPDISENLLGSGQICRLRLLHYWQIPECRQLFISSKSFTTLFCMPGLLPELDDTSDAAWQETVTQFLDFFPDDGVGRRIWKLFRQARSIADLNKAHRTAAWFRGHWHELFQPGVQDALGNLIAPLPETETIRLLNRAQDLIHLSAAHELCLDEYLLPITQGEYALYQIRHQGEFAIAGLRRIDNGPWEIDQIKGPKNSEPSEAMAIHIAAWHQANLAAIHPEMNP